MTTRTVTVHITVGNGRRETTFEVEDESPETIAELAKDAAFSMMDWGFEIDPASPDEGT